MSALLLAAAAGMERVTINVVVGGRRHDVEDLAGGLSGLRVTTMERPEQGVVTVNIAASGVPAEVVEPSTPRTGELALWCACGSRLEARTSETVDNPGRRFYTCHRSCRFGTFVWVEPKPVRSPAPRA